MGGVIARFGPWFGRIVKTSPALLTNLVNRLRAAGKTVQATVPGVIAFVKEHPLNALLVMSSLGDMGISIYHLFAHDDTTDAEKAKALEIEREAIAAGPEVKTASHTEVVAVTQALSSAVRKRIDVASAASEVLREDPKNPETREARAELLEEICSWAKGFFGSRESALNAHAMLQGFLELPKDDVSYAFAHLQLSR